jgi:hypothetical protein
MTYLEIGVLRGALMTISREQIWEAVLLAVDAVLKAEAK